MRYLENETTFILANFTTGDTVTIDVYRLSDNVKVINAAAMTEISTSGRFKYSFSQTITTKTEYLYICTNSIEEQQGKIILGGYPDDIYDRIGAPVGATISADVAAVAAAVWDEILTGATHNIATSAGRRVRQLGAFSVTDGTAQGANGHSITLEAAETAGDHTLNRSLIVIVEGTGKGQTRTIVDYDSATKIAVLDRDWWVTPDATSEYQVLADDTPLVVDHGVAQGATTTTITLRPCASAIDDTYTNGIITILAGTGQGQIRLLLSYDGTTKIATICGDDWITTPDTTSVYVVMPYGVSATACITPEVVNTIADGVWDEDLTGHTTAKTGGWFVQKIKTITDVILAMVT